MWKILWGTEFLNKIPAPLQYLKIITRCDNLVANVVPLFEICKVALSNTDMEFFTWDALRNVVQVLQFKRWKTPMKECYHVFKIAQMVPDHAKHHNISRLGMKEWKSHFSIYGQLVDKYLFNIVNKNSILISFIFSWICLS